MSPETVYQPDFLYAQGRLQEGAALRVDAQGRVLPAGAPSAGAQVVPLPGRVLIPGLVNAHSHAFQRLIRGRTEYVAAGTEADDFWSWREAMYRAAETLSPEELYVVSRQAFLEMVLSGITTVGEFHYLHHQPSGEPYADRNELALQVLRAAEDVGLRITLLRVGYARAGYQVEPNPRQRRFVDASEDAWLASTEQLAIKVQGRATAKVGLAPHSVRAVPRTWLEAARSFRGPLHMHVAEQPAEVDACAREYGLRPVEFLASLELLAPRFTAVHAVHLTGSEVQLLGATGAQVCACPSTERNLGDGVVPADLLVAAGVSICLGSDSQAMIDLFDEARQIEGHLRLQRLKRAVLDPGEGRPTGLAQRLFKMASEEGARSLGWEETGTLAPGSWADFCTVDLRHPTLLGGSASSLLAHLMFGAPAAAVKEVAVAGVLKVKDGMHPLLENSAQAFESLSRRLYA